MKNLIVMIYYDFKSGSGKNLKFPYYLMAVSRLAIPAPLLRSRLAPLLRKAASRCDYDYICSRVDYYNRLLPGAVLPADSPEVGSFGRHGAPSAYWLDSEEYIRWFGPHLRWRYLFGDVIEVPPHPSIVKSRPIRGDIANSVVLNLEKVRHFTFIKDRRQFREKDDRVIFRGDINGKPHRVRFMEMFFGREGFDTGIIAPRPEYPAAWSAIPSLTLWEHLDAKFIMALEGNDVASNLKWIMSSNSVAVMPRPKYETWFMEGSLIADHHYIEVKDDYSDLGERIAWFTAHPEECEKITRNAHEHIAQFLNPRRERIISLMVLEKYFRATGQKS